MNGRCCRLVKGPALDGEGQDQPAQEIAEVVGDDPEEQPDLVGPEAVAREARPRRSPPEGQQAGRPVRQARLSESVRSCSSLRSRPARMHAVVDYIPLAMSSQVRDNMARFSTSRYVPAMIVPTLARRAASVASSKIRMRERARYNAPERASRYRSIHAWHYAPERARYRSIHA